MHTLFHCTQYQICCKLSLYPGIFFNYNFRIFAKETILNVSAYADSIFLHLFFVIILKNIHRYWIALCFKKITLKSNYRIIVLNSKYMLGI